MEQKKSKFSKDCNEFAENLRVSFEAQLMDIDERSQLDVIVTVIQADGSTKSSIFNVITLALLNAGV